MWAKLLQKDLSEALSVVRPTSTLHATTVPQTLDVLIKGDEKNNRLIFTSTDGGTTATTMWIDAQVTESRSVSVPIGILTNFVKALPNGEIVISLVEGENGIKIECQSYESHIHGHDIDDFPAVPEMGEDGETLELEPGIFLRDLRRVLPAVSKERSRPVLGGVKMDVNESEYTLVAADGYRLAVNKSDLPNEVSKPVGIILPSQTLKNIEHLLVKGINKLQLIISADQKRALFKTNNVEIVTSLLNGEFPDYNKLLPTSWKTRMTVVLPQFKQSTSIASVFVSQGSGIVRLIAGDTPSLDTLKIVSQSDDIGQSSSDMNVKLEGEEIKVAFNYAYLNDVMNAFDGAEDVVLETVSSASPSLFTSPSVPGYKHVIMPMFVQW